MIRFFYSTGILISILLLIFANPTLVVSQKGSRNLYELDAGTRIRVRMDNGINSKSSAVNDTFTVEVTEPVKVRDIAVLPAGSRIEGRVTEVRSGASAGKGGSLNVRFETLDLGEGKRRNIDAVLVSELHPESVSTRNAMALITGTVVGALLGSLIRGRNGALLGAGIGAGAGTAAVVIGRGKEVGFIAGEEFEIKLTRKVLLPAEGF